MGSNPNYPLHLRGKLQARARSPPLRGSAPDFGQRLLRRVLGVHGLTATTDVYLGPVRAGPLHRWFVIASAAVILAVTLFPIAGAEPQRWINCLVCGERGIADFVDNILLFLPFGAALAAAGFPLPRCVLSAALLSASVEFAQLYIPGRDPSLGDVVSNTFGSGLGAVLVATAHYWLLPPRAQAARLSWGAALAAAAVCYGTGWLLAPAPPQTRYFALWTPNLAHLAPYQGRVLDAMIGEVRFPGGPIANSAAARDALRSPEGFSLRVRAVAGPRPAGVAPLFAVYDQHQREILLLGPDRDDLVFRFRTRAATWRLDQPDMRLVGALRAVAPGDSLDVTVHGRRGRYAVTINSSATAALGFTLGSGWALLMYPESLPAWLKALLSVAWVAALWVPAGFWARTRRDGSVIVVTVTIALLGAPVVTSLRATPVLHWAAAVLGAVAAAAYRLVVESRERVGAAGEARPQQPAA